MDIKNIASFLGILAENDEDKERRVNA